MDTRRFPLQAQSLKEAGEAEKGIALWTAAADRGDPAVQNNLAWLLATAKDPKLHDGKKAIAYAEKGRRARFRASPQRAILSFREP